MSGRGNITFGERVASAAFGALFGAIIGAALVWLLGVYSQTLGPSRRVLDGSDWILGTSAVFALLGFLLGSHVGTVVGGVISGLIEFERQDRNPEVPTWLVVVVLVGAAVATVWWLST